MRMSVDFCNTTMCCPTCMSDTTCSFKTSSSSNFFTKSCNFTSCFYDLSFRSVVYCDSGTVISTIF